MWLWLNVVLRGMCVFYNACMFCIHASIDVFMQDCTADTEVFALKTHTYANGSIEE